MSQPQEQSSLDSLEDCKFEERFSLRLRVLKELRILNQTAGSFVENGENQELGLEELAAQQCIFPSKYVHCVGQGRLHLITPKPSKETAAFFSLFNLSATGKKTLSSKKSVLRVDFQDNNANLCSCQRLYKEVNSANFAKLLENCLQAILDFESNLGGSGCQDEIETKVLCVSLYL